jgi:hypothetical protein
MSTSKAGNNFTSRALLMIVLLAVMAGFGCYSDAKSYVDKIG